MRKFFAYITIFFAFFFAIDRSLGLVMDMIYEKVKTGDQGGKINQYLALATVPELVVMGSSRAAHQIIPDSLGSPSFNLGHDGMYMPFQTALLRMMEQENKLPRVILLEIDPYEFMGNDNIHDVQNLKYYYHRSDTLQRYINALSPFEKYKFYIDSYRFNGRIINIIHNYLLTKQQVYPGNGYEMSASTKEDSVNTQYSSQSDVDHPEFVFNPRQVRYLNSFIEICERNNIRLICFTTPFFKPLDYFRRATQQIADRLTLANIPYIDLQDSLPALQRRPDYWKDSRHLNHEGSRILSGKLASHVKALNVPN